MTKTRVLITGGTGFVGKNLLAIAEGRLATDPRNNLSSLNTRDCEIFNFARGEHEDEARRFRPDVVINLAGEIRNERKMLSANMGLLDRLLRVTRETPYTVFIHVGSSSEYGRKTEPMRETDPCSPETEYEFFKWAATQLCQFHARKYGKNVVVARPFSLYGPYENPERFFPRILNAAETGAVLEVAPGVHDWTYVEDFIGGLWTLARADPRTTKGQIVNFGTGVQTSNDEVVAEVARLYGRPITYGKRLNAMRSYDSDNWRADTRFALEAFRWQAHHTLAEGLRRYVRAPAPALA